MWLARKRVSWFPDTGCFGSIFLQGSAGGVGGAWGSGATSRTSEVAPTRYRALRTLAEAGLLLENTHPPWRSPAQGLMYY